MPKQHYYVVSKLGRRLINLGMGRVALSWVGVNGREERQIVESVMNQYPDSWRGEWLRLKGLPHWADYYQSLENTMAGSVAAADLVRVRWYLRAAGVELEQIRFLLGHKSVQKPYFRTS